MTAPDAGPATPRGAPEPEPCQRNTAGEIVLVIAGPIRRADVPALCDRLHRLLVRAGGSGPVTCDVGALTEPDAATIDALARMQLTARRLGRRIRLRNASARLNGLLALTGLDVVLPLQSRGQAEQGEQLLRAEEGVEPDDPAL